jgi:hypothetical protein
VHSKVWRQSALAKGPCHHGQISTLEVHRPFGQLGVGTVTHSVLQIGLAIAAAFAAIGGMAILTGLGLIWVVTEKKEESTA